MMIPDSKRRLEASIENLRSVLVNNFLAVVMMLNDIDIQDEIEGSPDVDEKMRQDALDIVSSYDRQQEESYAKNSEGEMI